MLAKVYRIFYALAFGWIALERLIVSSNFGFPINYCVQAGLAIAVFVGYVIYCVKQTSLLLNWVVLIYLLFSFLFVFQIYEEPLVSHQEYLVALVLTLVVGFPSLIERWMNNKYNKASNKDAQKTRNYS